MLDDKYIELIKQRDNPLIETPEHWCKQCGLCCYNKSELPDGSIIYLNSKCEWLQSDNLCKVYGSRMTVFRHCVTARIALYLNILPEHCPYVKNNMHIIGSWYKPPIIPETIYKDYRKQTKK
jgi:uncharacterized protein